jgi:rhodanese-related sulfurtransferase
MKKIAICLTFALAVCTARTVADVRNVTPEEAYQRLKQEDTYLIDVRSVAEYVFVGHPEMAYCIPLSFWDEKLQKLIPNPDFLQDIQNRFKKTDYLIFICRSGGRSTKAAQIAEKAGFTEVLNIDQGFEGEVDENGYRAVNGWKNRPLPFTYAIDEKLIYRKSD